MIKKAAKVIILVLFCVLQGCVAPNAIKAEIQGIGADMGQLEKIADDLSVWRKNVEADTINYGGAGYVVIGTGVMAVIFLGTGLLIVRAFLKRGNLLALLTCAIQKQSPEAVRAIKMQLKKEVAEGRFLEQDRRNLGSFARNRGTFAEQK